MIFTSLITPRRVSINGLERQDVGCFVLDERLPGQLHFNPQAGKQWRIPQSIDIVMTRTRSKVHLDSVSS
jgi:hypothetical protein